MPDDLEDRLDDIYEAVLAYDGDTVAKLVEAEITADTEISRVLDDALITAMDEVGALFANDELFVPEMLMAAKAMQAGLGILKPLLAAGDNEPLGTIVVGTVHQDLHEIGKNLVGMMLEGAGFQVIDLGVDVPVERFVSAVTEHQADIVGMSALLTTTMPNMRATVRALQEAHPGIRVMVGGAPVTREFAEDCGADGHAVDAPGAVSTARELIGSKAN